MIKEGISTTEVQQEEAIASGNYKQDEAIASGNCKSQGCCKVFQQGTCKIRQLFVTLHACPSSGAIIFFHFFGSFEVVALPSTEENSGNNSKYCRSFDAVKKVCFC